MISTIDEMQEEYFEFLDDLRKSGVTNMFGAVPYLIKEFPEMDYREAAKWLAKWMQTFDERHPNG